MNTKIIYFLLFLVCFSTSSAQERDELKEKERALRDSKNLTWEANNELSENDFVGAEANYRRAISKSKENPVAPYNLGNAYYNNASFSEAFGRYKEAGESASEKRDKHKAYHNMGNVFMKNKEYEKAVEGYKEALRNNPTDEETRYNLALAKELLKKQQDEQKNDDNKDNKDNKDQKEKNQDQQDQGDKGDQEEDKNKDQGDQEKDDNKQGEGDEKKEEQKQPKEGDQPKEQKQPRPNQLSPQQIKNLLEAMQNEEKKVQEKIDAKKVKGVKRKNEKDW